MKKFFIILLSVICATCVAGAIACSNDECEHSWVATEETDGDGNIVYVCENCGEQHEHTFATEYTYDATGHWFKATCSDTDGCSSATKGYSVHTYEEGSAVCSVCGYDSTVATTYNIQFSYYQYDENGDIVVSSTDSSSYVEVGVTYTATQSSSGYTVDVENGDTVIAGDVVSFTIKKSVYHAYTDGNDYPVAYVNDEPITRGTDGVYSFTVADDMATDDGNLIVWVGNVELPTDTITGSGSQDDPLTINCVADWLYFATYINEDFYTSLNAAYWALGCDLDFEGEEAYIVGDGTTTTGAYFMGSFDGNGHTLSNFVIDNEISSGTYSTYVGLFGICSAYSGISAVIENLNIENFEIKCTSSTDSACVAGGIVGYGMGFNLVNCSASNGTITVNGNDSYYSYGGGLIGILQSYYDEDNDIAYYSSIQYCSADNVSVTGSGILYAAGGVAGYVSPYAESAPVYIINNAVTSTVVSGATRAGGVVGSAGRYTSVQNSFATGSISASCSVTYTYDDFKGTQLDDTISYAGGVVGYAENDTVIAACFFVGNVTASADSGTKYTGYLYGGCAAAGYENYYSAALISLNNLNSNDSSASSSDITSDKLKAAGWQDVDWTFGGTYPAINSETGALTYTITINVDGAAYETITVDSTVTSNVYATMSNRYLLYDTSSAGGISIYLRKDENNVTYRTYGYYFDAACTQRIPSGYVITGNTTIYAKFIDCSGIMNKEYYVTGNGSTATIMFYANGSYSYEEGVVYLSGTYEYDGNIITFKDGYFSRLSSAASDNQASSYYNFYAVVNGDGNLEIYDCSAVYTDTYSSSYDYLARFYAIGDPLVATYSENVTFAGKYSGSDGYTYNFNVDYAGTYTNGSASGSMTYTIASDGTVVVMVGNSPYLAKFADDKITSLVYYFGGVEDPNDTINLTAYDEFEGSWTEAGLVDKIYTFDGLGNWTYTDANASEGGTYTITNGTLTLTRADGTVVTAALTSDGMVEISSTSYSYDVTLYGEYSISGTWYTAGHALPPYYTLVLYGINSDGWGDAEYRETSGFRYTVNSISTDGSTVRYDMYNGDSLYAYFDYSVSTGILEGIFYNSSTESYDTSYTFYIYDAYCGTWVGSSADFAQVVFDGLGFYNVAAADTDSVAVYGTVTITGTGTSKTSTTYSVSLSTGAATFTYNNVEYTLVYDEFNNSITMTAADGTTVTLAEKDEYADVVFYTESGVTYSFDGRGYLTGGGVITVTAAGGSETTATYEINASGVITVDSGYTIYSGNEGYQLSDGTALYVSNSFTGTYAINGWYKQLVIVGVRYIYDGENNITVNGTYDGTAVTLYYNGEQMWFTVTVDGADVTYYITSYYGAVIISTTQTYTDDKSYAYMAEPDALCGVWTASDGSATLTFDGITNYKTYGNVKYTAADGTEYTGTYYYENGCYYVYVNGATTAYTLTDTASTYAYTNGGSYLVVNS